METKRVAVIDVDSICFTIGNPNKVLDETGTPIKVKSQAGNMVFQYVEKTEEELTKSADQTMSTILNNCGCNSYIGYIKGKNTTKVRLQINPEYKQNRKAEQPTWWEFVKQYLISVWHVHEIHNIEVDDAVNITRLAIPDSFIVAIDGDLLGLEGTHFKWRLKDSLNGEWIKVTEDQADDKFWHDMIVGQPGDNISGLRGKGEAYWKRYYAPEGKWVSAKRQSVFTDYCQQLGEYEGIQEFYRNYMSLKILDTHPGLIIPEPTKWPFIEIELEKQKKIEELFK